MPLLLNKRLSDDLQYQQISEGCRSRSRSNIVRRKTYQKSFLLMKRAFTAGSEMGRLGKTKKDRRKTGVE